MKRAVRSSAFGVRGKKLRTPNSQLRTPNRTADLLFEIGTEELPAAYLPSLIEQLGVKAKALLALHHLTCRSDAIESFGTPRRLVLIVRGLDPIQRTPSQEIRGPAKAVAYDKDGQPTAALLGFLRSRGGTLEQTTIISSEKGEHVYLIKPATEKKTIDVLGDPLLGDPLGQLIDQLQTPKTMRWDESGTRFARPIRWLLALYGSTPILGIRLGIKHTGGQTRLQPGRLTRIGRPQALREVRVASVLGYFQTLQRVGIILDQRQRRSRIERAVSRIAAQVGGRISPEMVSHGLLDEVTHLVETPVPLVGGFDATYLTLPREVLLASMAKHQRVFAMEAQGKLLPNFVAILEGKPKRPATVKRVIERILNARLADSLMFWNEDRKRSLDDLTVGLDGVTFHERFGTMLQKTHRLIQLSGIIGELWGLSSQELEQLRAACTWAKADLVSTMVKEFPTLQGVMGGKLVAESQGGINAVAEAIEEHYLPLAGKLPKTLLGSALAILDKYDTLAAYFSMGIEPTGDQDPFGLRRAAQGIVEVGWAVKRPLDINKLFACWKEATLSQGLDKVDRSKFLNLSEQTFEQKKSSIRRYIFDRLYTFAWPSPVPTSDCIDAVLASPCDNLIDAMDRIVSLQQLAGHPGLRKAAKVIERTRNILRGAPLRQPQVDPARLAEPPERKLWDVYASNHERIARLAAERSYGEATTLFGELFFEPLHEFFDRVLVNVPDEPLQQNRLALMQAIHTLYTERIADLSKLTRLLQQREETP